jgi:hypothetical protein
MVRSATTGVANPARPIANVVQTRSATMLNVSPAVRKQIPVAMVRSAKMVDVSPVQQMQIAAKIRSATMVSAQMRLVLHQNPVPMARSVKKVSVSIVKMITSAEAARSVKAAVASKVVAMIKAVTKARSANKTSVLKVVAMIRAAAKARSVNSLSASMCSATLLSHVQMVRSVKMVDVWYVPMIMPVKSVRSAITATVSSVAAMTRDALMAKNAIPLPNDV